MSDSAHSTDEQTWRLVVLELYRSQEGYLRAMKDRDNAEAIARAWDRLEDAARRRDEFLGHSGAHELGHEPMRA